MQAGLEHYPPEGKNMIIYLAAEEAAQKGPMNMYNVVMGWAAAISILAGTRGGWLLYTGMARGVKYWWTVPAVLGIILFPLSLLMVVDQPLWANPAISSIFGEPNLILGVVLIVAAALLAWKGSAIDAYIKANPERGAIFKREKEDSPWPMISPLFFFVIIPLGLYLIVEGITIIRFTAVGGAPAWEPITGRLGHRPLIENTLFGLLYLVPGIALGILLPLSRVRSPRLSHYSRVLIVVSLWIIGLALLGFCLLNIYTHAGMLLNSCVDPHIPVESPNCKNYEFLW